MGTRSELAGVFWQNRSTARCLSPFFEIVLKYASMANITSISYVERRGTLLFGNIAIDTGLIAGGVLIIPVFLPNLAKPQAASAFPLPPSAFPL
jgi:hypothetical protein